MTRLALAFVALLGLVQSQMIRQCTCNEFKACEGLYENSLVGCSDKCQVESLLLSVPPALCSLGACRRTSLRWEQTTWSSAPASSSAVPFSVRCWVVLNGPCSMRMCPLSSSQTAAALVGLRAWFPGDARRLSRSPPSTRSTTSSTELVCFFSFLHVSRHLGGRVHVRRPGLRDLRHEVHGEEHRLLHQETQVRLLHFLLSLLLQLRPGSAPGQRPRRRRQAVRHLPWNGYQRSPRLVSMRLRRWTSVPSSPLG